jgi:chemotaxis protein CheX
MGATATFTEVVPLDAPQQGVRDSVIATLQAACGVEPHYQGNDRNTCPCDGIAGIISLVGDVDWSLMLTLPSDSAVGVAQRFAGFEIEYDSEDMTDLIGEVANVIAGDVVARLEDVGVKTSLSLPMVVRGQHLNLMLPAGHPRVHMCFDSECGPIFLILGSRKQS